MYSTPRLLQGVFEFVGHGYESPSPLTTAFSYTVPTGKRAQATYLRAGNSSNELIYLTLMRDGKAMRYFPIGAKSDAHVALALVEDLSAGTQIDLYLGAPEGISGSVVVDLGLVEI